MMRQQLRPALTMFVILTALTGLIYPLAINVIAQLLFPYQANGSLIVRDGKVIGSELIGQYFDQPKYFWGRPSATSPLPYNAAASSGSNLGPSNPILIEAVKTRVGALRAVDPDNKAPIPVDLVTASASGLDPHISPAAAEYQVTRVARTRGLDENTVRALVAHHIEERQFGLFGERHVNVLKLNLALDALTR